MSAVHTQSVPSVERAVIILELLAASRIGLTLPEIAGQTRLPKSSVHCLLVTLQRLGYLHRNEKTSRYMFGLKLFSLANMALSGLKLREQAAPFLKGLAERTHLTTHMAILEHREAVLVAKYEPPGIFRLATWIGKRMDVHCTSLGKALIAYLPEDELDEIIKQHGLPRHNENTLCSRKKLKEDLALAVQHGYAMDDEEDELGLRCIGAPIFGPDSSVLASISIAGSTALVTPESVTPLARVVVEAAKSISESLGHSDRETP